MLKMAIIGDANSILAFSSVGASTFEAQNQAQAEEALSKIVAEKFALVLITENLQPLLQRMLNDNPSLVYLFIPPIREATGAGARIMEEIVQKTVGVKH